MHHQIKSHSTRKLFQFLLVGFIMAAFSSCIATKSIVYVEEKDQKDGKIEYVTQNIEQHKVEVGDRFFIQITDPLSSVSLGSSIKSSNDNNQQRQNVILQSPTVHDYLVKENGKIDLPLLGEIDALGKTIEELTGHIKKSCDGYISNPSIKLYMTNYNVTVLGEVNNPNFYQLITRYPTFFDAIGMANDMTDYADRKQVKIMRRVEGKVEVAYVDVTDPAFISSPYFFLQPNDVIHVMPLKVKKFNRDNGFPVLLSSIGTIITILTIISTR